MSKEDYATEKKQSWKSMIGKAIKKMEDELDEETIKS